MAMVHSNPFPDPVEMSTRRILAGVSCLLLMGLTFGIRLPLLRLPIFTDEGTWVAVAWLLQDMPVNHPNTAIALFPWLFQGIARSGLDTFGNLRMVDAFFAGTTSVFFFLFLGRSMRSGPALVAAVLWILAFNHPRFIDAGMKNPIAPASTCLMAGLWLVALRVRYAPALSGVLLGIGTALREPYIFFVIPLLYTIACNYPRKKMIFEHLLCLALTVSVFVLVRAIQMGGFSVMLDYGHGTWLMYGKLRELDGMGRWGRIVRYGVEAFSLTRWLVIPVLMGSGILMLPHFRGHMDANIRLVPALILPVIPETLNWPFPYHFGQFFFGICMLAGLIMNVCIHCLPGVGWTRWGRLVVLGVTSLLLMHSLGGPCRVYWKRTLETAGAYSGWIYPGKNTETTLRTSFYYDLGATIREQTTPDEKIVVSGFYYALYPISGRKPANPDMLDMTVSDLQSSPKSRPENPSRVQQAPVLIVESTRFPIDKQRLPDDFGVRYELFADYPPGTHKHYGHFGARVWKRRD